jgi:hypothetical protein
MQDAYDFDHARLYHAIEDHMHGIRHPRLGRLIALEPAQAGLLDRVCAGHLITHEELEAAGALKQPEAKPFSSAPKVKAKKRDKQSAGE